ncbi:hypothetical protein ACFLZ2_01140 [Candidatus Margulisiibacteriota bacterium]
MMGLFDNMGSKLSGGIEAAKRGFSFAADKTKKGANVAKIQVEIRMEDGKRKNLYADLGKHVFDLMNNGVFDMANDGKIKNLIESIRKSDDQLLKLNEELKLV